MKNKPSRQMRRATGLSMPRRQRGAAAVFGAVALVAMVISMLLGINVGMLYFAQRDLQKLAVLAAMAGVETGSGCINGFGTSDTTTVINRVRTALSSNLPSGTDPDKLLNPIGGVPKVQLGRVTVGKPGASSNDGQYHFSTLADKDPRINAVVVNLTEPQPAILGASFFSATPGTLYASATAMQQPVGGFSIGSTLLSLNTGNSALLNPLLSALRGSSVNLSAVDYANLASTQISLAGLMAAAGVNDLNSLLALNVNQPQLQQILAAATSTVNPSAANLIQGLTLGNAQANQNVPLATLLGNIGNGLNPTVTDAASLVPSLDLLDLLTQIGQAAAAQNPSSFLTLTGTPSVPGLLNTYLFLSIQQPMQPGYGPVGSTAQTAQIQLDLRANVDTSGLNGLLSFLSSLLLGIVNLQVQPINIGLDLNVAQAVATLNSLTCPLDNAPAPTATIGVQTSVANLKLGTFTAAAQTNPALVGGTILGITDTGLLHLLNITVATKSNSALQTSLGDAQSAQAPTFIKFTPAQQVQPAAAHPHDYYYQACNSLSTNPQLCSTTDPNNPSTPIPTVNILSGIASLVAQLTNKNNLVITVAGLNLSDIVDPLLSALNSVLIAPLTQALNLIINPLLSALGLQVASGTVLMNVVETGRQTLVSTALPGTPNF